MKKNKLVIDYFSDNRNSEKSQGFIGSLTDKKWNYIQVEPDSENDKIDILWEYPNNKMKVVQVKSSQNDTS